MVRATSHWRHLDKRSIRKSPHYCWLRSLKSRGLEPVIECLEVVEREKLKEAEIFWISYMRFLGFPLLNILDGDEDFPVMRGEKNGMFGRKNSWGHHRPEVVEQMRLRKLGTKNSKETRERIRKARSKQKMKNYKPIVCLTTGETFTSLKEAVSKLGVCYSKLSEVLHGTRKHTRGLRFSFQCV